MTGQVLLSLIILLGIFLWQAGLILNFQVVKLPTSKLSARIHFCTSLPLALALLIQLGPTGHPIPSLIFPECLLPQQWDHGWDGTKQQFASHVTQSNVQDFPPGNTKHPGVLLKKKERNITRSSRKQKRMKERKKNWRRLETSSAVTAVVGLEFCLNIVQSNSQTFRRT